MAPTHVFVYKDVEHRTTGNSTWVESGRYPVVRQLADGRYLISTNRTLKEKERVLTIVRQDEVQ